MARFPRGFINLSDLYVAYRKAKAEAFYGQTDSDSIAWATYEQHLHKNLSSLKESLHSDSPDWCERSILLGGHVYAPKSIECPSPQDLGLGQHRLADPVEDFKRLANEQGSEPIECNFRQLISPTVNLQIISALWILKAGHRFEAKVSRQHSFGHRLRRMGTPLKGVGVGKLNSDSHGLFNPYFVDYKKWQANGLDSIRQSLGRNKSIVAVTMDIQKFYHSVDPEFVLSSSFQKVLRVELSEAELLLTSDLVRALRNWHADTLEFVKTGRIGLPVGLSASKIVSNVLLAQFDRYLAKTLRPLYYGRYVDDIFLVVERPDNVRNSKDFVKWLVSSMPGYLRLEETDRSDRLTIGLKVAEANDLTLTLSEHKQKLFFLDGKNGLDVVNEIEEQFRKRSSEHRMVPVLSEDGSKLISKAIQVLRVDGDAVDTLRKADSISIRRLDFALLLRDVEQYARDLDSNRWKKARRDFYDLVFRYIVTPQGIFDYFTYLQRIVGLMIVTRDYIDAAQLVARCKRILEVLQSHTSAGREHLRELELFRSFLVKLLYQAIVEASTAVSGTLDKSYRNVVKELREVDLEFSVPNLPKLRKLKNWVLKSDFGRRPYKEYWIEENKVESKIPKPPLLKSCVQVLRLPEIRRFRVLAEKRTPWWPALAFPTRPLTLAEIVYVAPEILGDPAMLKKAIWGLRGARTSVGKPRTGSLGFNNESRELFVANERLEEVSYALTSFETSEKQWVKSLGASPDHSFSRYRRAAKLINLILQSEKKPQYVIFPEVSLPLKWAKSFAVRLQKQGVSFLAGVENANRKSSGPVTNDVFISLVTKWPGYLSSVWIRQPKMCAAHEEAKNIKKTCGKSLRNPVGPFGKPFVIVHGGYCFGVLICSDLTDVRNRAFFRGKIDALVLVEWNKDINTFDFLVQSSAHDLSSFVVQVNSRQYGDSRIRAPYTANHRRDLVRVRGGDEDYFVLGQVDFRELRKHQVKTPTVKAVFKPVPTGFLISDYRKSH